MNSNLRCLEYRQLAHLLDWNGRTETWYDITILPSGSRSPPVGVLDAIGTDTLVAWIYYIIFNAMSYNKGDGCPGQPHTFLNAL
ncbi:MAG: hypothetical protein LVT47_03725 [Cyanobacteria bacterium LVE1205-1]